MSILSKEELLKNPKFKLKLSLEPSLGHNLNFNIESSQGIKEGANRTELSLGTSIECNLDLIRGPRRILMKDLASINHLKREDRRVKIILSLESSVSGMLISNPKRSSSLKRLRKNK